jgi:hypothetical protein
MGADFIFDYVILNKDEEKAKKSMLKAVENFNIIELSKDIKQRILNSLEGNKSKEFLEFYELWEDVFSGDFDEKGFPIDNEDNLLTEEKVKEMLKKIIEDLFSCLDYRDVSCMIHKGEKIYLSGGMNYGDSPTDSMETIRRFNCLPKKIRNCKVK